MYLLYSKKRCDLCLFLRCLLNEVRIKKFKKAYVSATGGVYADRIQSLILHTDRAILCARFDRKSRGLTRWPAVAVKPSAIRANSEGSVTRGEQLYDPGVQNRGGGSVDVSPNQRQLPVALRAVRRRRRSARREHAERGDRRGLSLYPADASGARPCRRPPGHDREPRRDPLDTDGRHRYRVETGVTVD